MRCWDMLNWPIQRDLHVIRDDMQHVSKLRDKLVQMADAQTADLQQWLCPQHLASIGHTCRQSLLVWLSQLQPCTFFGEPA